MLTERWHGQNGFYYFHFYFLLLSFLFFLFALVLRPNCITVTEASNQLVGIMYGLLTKLARSRWLDIGLVFLRVYGPRSRGP